MGLLFVLIFFFIPWQVAYLSCWIIHLYTCASTWNVVGHGDPIPLLARDENENEVEPEDAVRQSRSALLQQQRLTRENNENLNSHMLLFMTWLLPIAAPVLVVWVRTLVTAGLTTPFDGDHFFWNVAPFLILVDFASWNSNDPMYPKSARYVSIDFIRVDPRLSTDTFSQARKISEHEMGIPSSYRGCILHGITMGASCFQRWKLRGGCAGGDENRTALLGWVINVNRLLPLPSGCIREHKDSSCVWSGAGAIIRIPLLNPP